MATPTISIIVPIYNSENYLHRCVDSILAQTFRDFEVLLIDDGSTDKSGEICDEYARTDERIRVFHEKNEGVGRVRQFGLDNSKGDFVTFVDSDDWIENKAYEEMIPLIKRGNADMTFCDFYEDNDKIKYNSQKPSGLDSKSILKDMFALNLVSSCWNRIIKRKIIDQYDACFIKGMNHWEDLFFNGSLLKENINVLYLPEAYYHYDQKANMSSLTCIKKGRYKAFLDSIPVFIRKFENVISSEEIKKFFLHQALDYAFYADDFYDKSCRQDFRKYLKVLLLDNSYKWKRKILYIMLILNLNRIMALGNALIKRV